MPSLPQALPPAERTVGQLIAETIRLYGRHFWRCLLLGVPIAASTQLSLGHSVNSQTLILFGFTPLIALAYVWACSLVLEAQMRTTAYLLAVLVFLPVPFLLRLFVLPGLAWLALFGLAAPAAMLERLGFRAALSRARGLARADYVHAIGSLCGLVVVVVIAELTLIALLRSQGDNGQRVAHFLADLIMSPLLYLGGGLLYLDQAARVGSGRSARRKQADPTLAAPADGAPAAGEPEQKADNPV